jgi:hypothetical protein
LWLEPEASNWIGAIINRNKGKRGVRHTIPASDEPAILQTILIPTGRSVGTLRVYNLHDLYGRYLFNSDASLEDWYNYDCSDNSKGGYIIDTYAGTDGYGALVGNPDLTLAQRGVLYLRPMNWANEYLNGGTSRAYFEIKNNEDKCRFRADNFAADNNGDAPLVIFFDTILPSTDIRAEVKLVRVSSTTMKVTLETFDAGGSKDTDETAAINNQDLIIDFGVAYSLGSVYVHVFDSSGSLLDTLAADRQ